ncbi:hypothetical protein B0H10DRAFT_2219791 [Mycena sp. CBHHK59/15]|nr:hypothetical protein B0H10DRAFT_2219791 [Mycena sp. CBHHK59/15]
MIAENEDLHRIVKAAGVELEKSYTQTILMHKENTHLSQARLMTSMEMLLEEVERKQIGELHKGLRQAVFPGIRARHTQEANTDKAAKKAEKAVEREAAKAAREAEKAAAKAAKAAEIEAANLEFQVVWTDGDVTWEPLSAVNDCAAMDDYLAHHDVDDPICLPKRKGSWLSQRIHEWSVNFIRDEENLLTAEYGKMNGTVLEDEDLAQELHPSPGNWECITPDGAKMDEADGILVDEGAKGMYSDGHERQDIVDYQQNEFLLRWAELSKYTRKFTEDGDEIGSPKAAAAKALPKEKKKSKMWAMEELDEVWDKEEMEWTFIAAPDGRIVVICRHDECIFYANDRRKIRWVHTGKKAKPYAKGEGASMMVAAFISENRWLACWTFRPGGKRDGYYTTDKILEHAAEAMDILDETRLDKCHVFAYDNVTTHTARPPMV